MIVFFLNNPSVKKNIFFSFGGDEGKGGSASVSEFFYINNPNLKEIYIYIYILIWGRGMRGKKKRGDGVGDGARVSNFY